MCLSLARSETPSIWQPSRDMPFTRHTYCPHVLLKVTSLQAPAGIAPLILNHLYEVQVRVRVCTGVSALSKANTYCRLFSRLSYRIRPTCFDCSQGHSECSSTIFCYQSYQILCVMVSYCVQVTLTVILSMVETSCSNYVTKHAFSFQLQFSYM